MSDIVLELTEATPTTLNTTVTNVVLDLGGTTDVVLSTDNTPVTLDLTEATPVNLSFDCPASIVDSFSTLAEYDNDTDAGAAGIGIGSYYLTSDEHESLPGGVPKQRRY